MELEQLTPRVYQLPFSQENDRPALGYIRGDRFSLMVDAGNSPEHVRDYQKAVENAGFPQPDFTVLTHSHWDHCFGLSALSIPSIACVQTRQSLEMVSRLRWTPDALERHRAAAVRATYPGAFPRTGTNPGSAAHGDLFRADDP